MCSSHVYADPCDAIDIDTFNTFSLHYAKNVKVHIIVTVFIYIICIDIYILIHKPNVDFKYDFRMRNENQIADFELSMQI